MIFLSLNVNAFGAVSGFVDSKQVNQNLPMAIAFNPSGTKMFVVGMSQNKIYEFDLTTGFDVSTASKNSNESTSLEIIDNNLVIVPQPEPRSSIHSFLIFSISIK